jgi:hypothetical protein
MAAIAKGRALERKLNRAGTRRADIIDRLWPGEREHLWHRTSEDGFTTVPRTLSLIMSLIEELGNGKDASRVYFDLWCRQMDDSFVEVTDEEAFAFSCGYSTAGRNVRTWRERVELLADLGFLDIQPNGSKKFGYILVKHPYAVVVQLHANRRVTPAWWGAFVKRASEIGAVVPVVQDAAESSAVFNSSDASVFDS